MSKAIAFYETRSDSGAHATANAGLIGALLQAYPERDVHLFATDKHALHVREALQRDAPEFAKRVHSHAMSPLYGNLSIGKRLALLRRVFREGRAVGCDMVVIADPVQAYNTILVLGAKAVFAFGVNTLITYHGELGKIVGRAGSSQPASRLTVGAMIAGGAVMPVRYLVFSPHIATIVRADLPNLGRYLHGIPMPYYCGQGVPAVPKWDAGAPVRFGMLGGNRWLTKGYDTFAEVASALHIMGDCEFHLVGPYTDHEYIDDEAVEHVAAGGGFLSVEDYMALLNNLDYSVFPYRPKKYVYTASASFLDALSAGKPVIALANPFFEHVFAELGDIGYLCESVDEMQDTMRSLVETKPIDRYKAQQVRLLESREVFSVQEVGQQLREITGIL